MIVSSRASRRRLYYLRAPVKEYAWGSEVLLAQLTRTPKTGRPQAEMWFGTHPTTPTLLDDGTALATLVDLPYLVKLIAPAQPLSIQVHPSLELAQDGFARENAAGVALNDPKRTYRDANHKPELLVALKEFTAMAGFRDPRESAATFTLLASLIEEPEVSNVVNDLASQLDQGQLKLVFRQIVDPKGPFARPHGWTRAIFRWIAKSNTFDRYLDNAQTIANVHPDDPGALVALLLNLTVLSPGEALFIPSGMIHCYVSGLGLEVMASSDNVIRGGLTVKHVDVRQLERALSYTPGATPRITPARQNSRGVHVTRFCPPVDEFSLTQYDVPANSTVTIFAESSSIMICTSGTGQLRASEEYLELTPGTGIYVTGDSGALKLSAFETKLTVFIADQRGW